MRLWKVTHKETEKFIFVMAERWVDVRSFSSVQLETCGDFSKLDIEAAAPFDTGTKKRPKLTAPSFRIEWRGQAASNPSTLRMEVVPCETVAELYGEPPEPTKPRNKKRKK